MRISTFFQSTLAVTERGKVYAVGEKVAKLAKIETTKFGFYEVPLVDIASLESKPEKKGQPPNAQIKAEEAKAAEAQADEEGALNHLASMFVEEGEAPAAEEVKQPGNAPPSEDSFKVEAVPEELPA